MIRATIQSVIEGAIKRVTAAGRPGETLSDREYMQHYGYTSRPLAGAEGVIVNQGNHYILIATDDRRYRVAVETGEVCLYTDEGDQIRLKRNKEICVKSGNKLIIEATNDVSVTTKRINLTATESITLVSPNVAVQGALSATGNISSSGSITDTTGNTNHHSH